MYHFFASFHTVAKISHFLEQNMENSTLEVHQDWLST